MVEDNFLLSGGSDPLVSANKLVGWCDPATGNTIITGANEISSTDDQSGEEF